MSLTSVEEQLLIQNKLSYQDLYQTLDILADRRLDYADLYFQSSYHEFWMIEDSIIKNASYDIDQGVGIRAVSGAKTGFAYTDQINIKSLEKIARVARSIAQDNGYIKTRALTEIKHKARYSFLNPLQNFSIDEKLFLLHRIDTVARNLDSRVQEVSANITAMYEQVMVAATDSTIAADVRPLVCLSINIIVEKDGKRERASSGGGGRFCYSYFLEKINGEMRVDAYTKEAVRIALVCLDAVAAPAGNMPVVLGAGWPGVLLHEAVGHGLEGDFNRRGTSVFTGKVGQKVASELCTVVDDGTLHGCRGSLGMDDEGVPTQYNVLIEKGILKGYMQDKLNARLMGETPTGNGRRESYAHLPMPRMTNTYMLAGTSIPEEIIDSVKYGLYAPNFGGGQVDITSGKFVFSTSEAYLIEKGKITTPVIGATIIGSGIEAMKQISMVGNDLELDKGLGMCSKEGQSLPVGIGQPTLKINNLTVGGTT